MIEEKKQRRWDNRSHCLRLVGSALGTFLAVMLIGGQGVIYWFHRAEVLADPHYGFSLAWPFREKVLVGVPLDLVIIILLCLHYIRLYLGFYFIDHDASFSQALGRLEERAFLRLMRAEFLLRISVVVLTFALPFLLRRPGTLPSGLALVAQGALMIYFDFRFRRVLFHKDEDKTKNLLIVFNDVVLFLSFVFLLAAQVPEVLAILAADLAQAVCTVWLVVFLIVFYLELSGQYRQAAVIYLGRIKVSWELAFSGGGEA